MEKFGELQQELKIQLHSRSMKRVLIQRKHLKLLRWTHSSTKLSVRLKCGTKCNKFSHASRNWAFSFQSKLEKGKLGQRSINWFYLVRVDFSLLHFNFLNTAIWSHEHTSLVRVLKITWKVYNEVGKTFQRKKLSKFS